MLITIARRLNYELETVFQLQCNHAYLLACTCRQFLMSAFSAILARLHIRGRTFPTALLQPQLMAALITEKITFLSTSSYVADLIRTAL